MALNAIIDELQHLSCDGDSMARMLRRLPNCPTGTQVRDRRASGRRWRTVLQDIPYDEPVFDSRFGVGSRRRSIARLSAFCLRFRSLDPALQKRYEPLFGVLSLMLLLFEALRESERRRRPAQDTPLGGRTRTAPGHDCHAVCQVLFADDAVRQSIRWIYHPGAEAAPDGDDGGPVRQWEENVRFGSLRFLRHGTTSVVLQGEAAMGGGDRFALKLIILPFLRVPQIADATEDYWRAYGHLDTESVVRVWASARSWILMSLVNGVPLDEALRREQPGRSRLELLSGYGQALFTSLANLTEAWSASATPSRPAPGGHQDLSPSNIMVVDRGGRPELVLIDLGRNYLYTNAIVGLEGDEARYIAPEVRAGTESAEHADLYSAGHLLIEASRTAPRPDGTVPDVFYAHAPVVARFLEDLVDRSPGRRLAIFETRDYRRLGARFAREVEVAAAAGAGPLSGRRENAWTAFADLFRPLANSPKRFRRIYRVRQRQADLGNARQNYYARYLLIWAEIAAVAFVATALIVAFWLLRDLGWNWGGPLLELAQRAFGGGGSLADRLVSDRSPDTVPLLDGLRAPGYRIPDLAGNLPARLVGLTYAFVCAKYYENLFAGVAPLVIGLGHGRLSMLAIGAAFFMRLSGLYAVLFVLPFTLVDPDWWPVCAALGQTFTFLTNVFAAAFGVAAIRRARAVGLSTVPRHDDQVTGLAAFRQWTPSSAIYATIVWCVGILLMAGLITDEYVYAGAVAAINIALLYAVKCTGSGAAIRTFLMRAALAAERLRLPAGSASAEA